MILNDAFDVRVYTKPYDFFSISNWCLEYDKLIANLPPLEKYHRYNDKYKNRYLYDMSDPFWSVVALEFKKIYGERIRVQMCRDLPGYSIGPHTDGKREYMTVIYYLTDKEAPVGTKVYVPKKKGFTHDGTAHLEFDDFEEVVQAEYAPNKGFGFIRSDNSFHGVEACDIERNIIQVSVWA